MRFFIALDIPQQSKEELQKVQSIIQSQLPYAKISENDQLHLTIAFIGEQPEILKPKLIEVMNQAAAGIPPFEVTPSFIDGFPHLHTARILWAGVSGDIDKLHLLRHKIKDGLKSLNLEVDERRYVPHIALAKPQNLKLNKSQESALQSAMSQKFSSIKITSLKLFESIPSHGFHTHNTLAEIKLTPS